MNNKDSAQSCPVRRFIENFDPSRGSNVQQMYGIAKNHSMTRKEKKKFYRAVKKFYGRDWVWKACYANSQQFLTDSALSGELSYREGFVSTSGTPLRHAWLEWRGKVLDLTLGAKYKINEDDYFAYFTGDNERSLEVVRKNILFFESWTCLDDDLNPVLTPEERARMDEVMESVYGPKRSMEWWRHTAKATERRRNGFISDQLENHESPEDAARATKDVFRQIVA